MKMAMLVVISIILALVIHFGWQKCMTVHSEVTKQLSNTASSVLSRKYSSMDTFTKFDVSMFYQ